MGLSEFKALIASAGMHMHTTFPKMTTYLLIISDKGVYLRPYIVYGMIIMSRMRKVS